MTRFLFLERRKLKRQQSFFHASHQATLENGLTVYLSPNHEEPRFYAEIITRAEANMIPATNTGLAHYLEHLLFKGTSSFGTVDYENEKVLLDEITEFTKNDPGKPTRPSVKKFTNK